jgi:hypothetical protein
LTVAIDQSEQELLKPPLTELSNDDTEGEGQGIRSKEKRKKEKARERKRQLSWKLSCPQQTEALESDRTIKVPQLGLRTTISVAKR